MAAKVIELRTKPDRLKADQTERLRQALLPFEIECPEHVRELIGQIDRQTASRNKWTFVMLSPDQNAAVVDHLTQHSKRPLMAVRLWALCFRHLRTDTGEILLTREEMAEKLSISADNISEIMSVLVKFKAIITRRDRVKGLKGPGLVRYFMNPRVATNLSGAARDDAQAKAPPLLRLMETSAE
jgi:hypothetical protein